MGFQETIKALSDSTRRDILIFILGFEIYLIANVLGVPIGVNVFTSILLGALVTALGNYLPKIPQNFLIGVKTIWGYSNESIWLKTQRMAGRLWFVLGLLLMTTAFLTAPLSSIFRIVILVILILVLRLYGFTLFYISNKK